MKNNYDSIEDMQKMQQEAVRRVKEMQKRAKQSLTAASTRYSESGITPANSKDINKTAPPTKENLDTTQECTPQNDAHPGEELTKVAPFHQQSTNHCNKLDFFSTLTSEREKSLILLLILLLVDEGSDTSLIIALLYLII